MSASGREAISEFTVPPEGLFVDDGYFVEEGLIEALAQSAGAMEAFEEATQQRRSARGMLVGIKTLRILERPRSGDRITFRVQLERRLGPFTLVRARATRGATPIAEGQFKFYIEA